MFSVNACLNVVGRLGRGIEHVALLLLQPRGESAECSGSTRIIGVAALHVRTRPLRSSWLQSLREKHVRSRFARRLGRLTDRVFSWREGRGLGRRVTPIYEAARGSGCANPSWGG